MKYLLLIYADEQAWTEAERAQCYSESTKLAYDLQSKGQFLAAAFAGPVYQLLGKQGLGTEVMPGLEQPIMHTIGYHERGGKHDVTAYDWDQYLKFLEMHFKR